MPSEKPKLVARTDQEIIDKIKIIAKSNERSVSQEIIFLVKQEIEKYESEKGKITIQNQEKES